MNIEHRGKWISGFVQERTKIITMKEHFIIMFDYAFECLKPWKDIGK